MSEKVGEPCQDPWQCPQESIERACVSMGMFTAMSLLTFGNLAYAQSDHDFRQACRDEVVKATQCESRDVQSDGPRRGWDPVIDWKCQEAINGGVRARSTGICGSSTLTSMRGFRGQYPGGGQSYNDFERGLPG